MTQQSQIDVNLTIYFVVPSKYRDEDECSPDMQMAYDESLKIELYPKWITESQCHEISPTKTDVFVMEEFTGNVFNKLSKTKCWIIGPRCLTACILENQQIPLGPNPVFTTAMSGLCICVSGMTGEAKQRIEELVQYMGGSFTNQLRTSVTHLVTESVMSVKYENAAVNKISIVTKEWVEAIWKASLEDFVKGNDIIFEKYKAPVFLNLVVTSTNFSKSTRDEIKQLITDNGGTFMGPLDGSKVKLVLAPSEGPISEKLKYAKQANIPCLTPNWVHESIKAGYAMPFKDFLIESHKACSTPERSTAHESFDCSTISCIPSNYQQKNCIEESLMTTTISNSSNMPSISIASEAQGSTLDRLKLREAKLAGPFLDGCNIYLTGFAPKHKDKLNRILNVGGATRLDDISDALTHVIIGDELKATSDLKLIKSKGICPVLLSLTWLEESIKLKHPAPEENFLFELKTNISQPPVEPPSPLSKKNLQMLQKPKRPPIPTFNIDKKPAAVQKNSEPDFLQQYLAESTITRDEMSRKSGASTDTSTLEQNKPDSKRTSPLMEPNILRTSSTTEQANLSEDPVVMSQLSALNDTFFNGRTFVVTGFDDVQVEVVQTIMAFGGKIVPKSYAGIPDYAVVPIAGAPLRQTVNEIVTNLYIDDCVNQEAIAEIEYYHRPLSLNKHSRPLSNCVITMSTYTGGERMYLAALASELGAKYKKASFNGIGHYTLLYTQPPDPTIFFRCQDIFARRTNPEKMTLASTHLICRSPEGNKYNAAVKWTLPAVTADWLLECAAQLRRVDETPYLVGETIAPERAQPEDPESSSCNAQTSPKAMRTPKRALPVLETVDATTPDTPLINKRLSLITTQTPESPFHVSTPDSPYGQVFKPNPSPATRKGWLKWINNLPDLREKEIPVRRRRDSTPLSEIKRQLWDKLVRDSHALAHGPNTVQNDPDNSFGVANQHHHEGPQEEPNDIEENKDDEEQENCRINRKLEFADETDPAKYNNINLEILHLDQALERTSTTPTSRCSLISQASNTENTDNVKGYVPDSQPLESQVIGWEDPSHRKWSKKRRNSERNTTTCSRASQSTDEEEEPEKPVKRPKFMLTCIQNRAALEKVIRDLGGDVSSNSNFDDTATHLLCTKTSRNEKMLSSIASGKWVLHCSYLQDSEKEGTFLDEEKYEWGNPKSEGTVPQPTNDAERAIARAAYRWRVKIQTDSRGPYADMVALLLVAEDKYDQFRRLIEAGGGQVVQARPPYDSSPSGRKITHCFVSVKQTTQPIDWARFASKGILCFMPQYLHNHLTAETALNPRECVIPEFKKYLTLLPK